MYMELLLMHRKSSSSSAVDSCGNRCLCRASGSIEVRPVIRAVR